MTFQAKVSRTAQGDPWTFLRLPQEASDRLPTRSMVSVEGTINGFAFHTCLQPDGAGGHWLKLEPHLSEGAGVSPGDVVELDIAPMAVEPEPEVPDDLREALAAAPTAHAVWSDITAIARRDWIHWMTSGKRAETRAKRLETMIDKLNQGKRRACCFDRSGMYSKSLSCPTAAAED
ncbi:MAG: YdeI/OmpD-associated family protein [Fimbriimonas sp.]